MDETKMLYYFALIKRYCNSHRECYKCAFYFPYEYGGGGCAFRTNALGDKPSWWDLNKLESCAYIMCQDMRKLDEQNSEQR